MMFLAGTIAVGGFWLIRQVQRAWLRESLNLPKYLLLAAAIPMHWIALLTPMPNKPIALVAILTIYHNLQYHRLIWFHNKKYQVRTGSGSDRVEAATSNNSRLPNLRSKYGAAELISRRLLFYIAFGILFGLIYQGPRQYLGYLSLKQGFGVAAVGHHDPVDFSVVCECLQRLLGDARLPAPVPGDPKVLGGQDDHADRPATHARKKGSSGNRVGSLP